MTKFDYFVVLGAMRTGSNFLEAQLNNHESIEGLGELFNSAFLGRARQETILGIDMMQREADPSSLLSALSQRGATLKGFRYFSDHDPRVFEGFMRDPRCAKIHLTRNPLDSFVSLEIARHTGQWQLTNFTRRRAAKIEFSGERFEEYLDELDTFNGKIYEHLITSGQAAFSIRYEKLTDIDSINGLFEFLGVAGRVSKLIGKVKKQNPGGVGDLISNAEELEKWLSSGVRFEISRWFAPESLGSKRFPNGFFVTESNCIVVPTNPYLAGRVEKMLARTVSTSGFDKLRKEADYLSVLNSASGVRKFVLSQHPLSYAFELFTRKILQGEDSKWENVRRSMRNQHNVAIPEKVHESKRLTQEELYDAFKTFLMFLNDNLAGLSNIAVRSEWANQSEFITQLSQYMWPDRILRYPFSEEDCQFMMDILHIDHLPEIRMEDEFPTKLDDIWAPELEVLCREAYKTDYQKIGFQNSRDEA